MSNKHSFNQHHCLIDIYHHFPDKADILYTFRGCSKIFYLACINKRHLWLCNTREMVAKARYYFAYCNRAVIKIKESKSSSPMQNLFFLLSLDEFYVTYV